MQARERRSIFAVCGAIPIAMGIACTTYLACHAYGEDVGPDAGGVRPSTSASCAPTGGVQALGCRCSTPSALACNGNAQKEALICNGGVWMPNGACLAGQNCDSAAGTTQGLCVALDPPCANARPGQRVCGSATTVVECGPDLVSHSPVQTCDHQVCVAGACTALCTPGVSPCTSGTGTQTCDSQGYWSSGACTFAFTGDVQTWTVPAGVTKVTVEASGAAGGGKSPGEGGATTATVAVVAGETLAIYVGGQGNASADAGGFNGGGGISVNPGGVAGGGGGASDVRRGGKTLDSRVVVAGGGGGSGANTGCIGGAGGGTIGGAGTTDNGGQGGTQDAGGAGGRATYLGVASPGSLGLGGAGANNAGGGGGGYYGGGGGANPSAGCNGGGGGGSSFAMSAATGVSMRQGVVTGDGQVVLRW